jgi:hypothetical protein
LHDRKNIRWSESPVRRSGCGHWQCDGETQNGDSPTAPAIRTEQRSLHLHAVVI